MVNRVWIEPNVFRLSKPGQDVLTAPNSGLQFNGSYAGTAKFIRGSISGSRNGSGESTHTVNYGKTFTVKPFLMTNLIAGTGWNYPAGTVFPIKGFGDTAMPMGFYGENKWMHFTTRVGLSSVVYKVFSTGGDVTYSIDFQVFDYRV